MISFEAPPFFPKPWMITIVLKLASISGDLETSILQGSLQAMFDPFLESIEQASQKIGFSNLLLGSRMWKLKCTLALRNIKSLEVGRKHEPTEGSLIGKANVRSLVSNWYQCQSSTHDPVISIHVLACQLDFMRKL